MTGWEVQALKEAEDARIWEELNAPDPYEKILKEAAKDLEKARAAFTEAIDRLADASSVVSETPMQKKVDSLYEAAEDLKCEIWSLRMKYERGERE